MMKIGARVRIPGVGRFEDPELGTVIEPDGSEPDDKGMVLVEWDESDTVWEYEADLEEV